MFEIINGPIDIEKLKKSLRNDEAGALVVFEGWVRNHNEGKGVSSLEYEAFESLACKEALKVIEEAKEKFDILDISAVHRVGHMDVGEPVVWIGVNSKHREAGFRACRYVIDEIKLRLPIWKKEYYISGKTEWVNCKGCYNHAHIHYSENKYYEKQLKLKNFGDKDQAQLKGSSVLVVGAGGLGCPALSYLAAAGVGEITICDGDLLEISNLHRQTLYSHSDIGEYKSILAKKRLKGQNPFITINALTHKVNTKNAKKIISEHDLILDCTDNFETKFLIHDTCFFLKKSLVQASIYQDEGQLQTFKFESDSVCMRCVWPEVPGQGIVGNCEDVGVLGVVPGVLGVMQATEALKVLLGWETKTIRNTLLVDLMDWSITPIKRNKVKSCPLCSEDPKIKNLIDAGHGKADYEIDLSDLKCEDLSNYHFIDIRREEERDSSLSWEKILISVPFKEAQDFKLPLNDKPVILICSKGIRSKNLAEHLRSIGKKEIFSLDGGVSSFQKHWDRIQKI